MENSARPSKDNRHNMDYSPDFYQNILMPSFYDFSEISSLLLNKGREFILLWMYELPHKLLNNYNFKRPLEYLNLVASTKAVIEKTCFDIFDRKL